MTLVVTKKNLEDAGDRRTIGTHRQNIDNAAQWRRDHPYKSGTVDIEIVLSPALRSIVFNELANNHRRLLNLELENEEDSIIDNYIAASYYLR